MKLLLLLFLISCDNTTLKNDSPPLTVSISKWYKDYPAAITITYDGASPESSRHRSIQDELLDRSLVMDYELVTKGYKQKSVEYLKSITPLGFSYFGHGDAHDDHDYKSFKDAYQSFKACYDSMVVWGLSPIAYAYPYGSGRKLTTQRALELAGFYSGRGFPSDNESVPTYHIMPYDQSEPENWFLLPTLRMEDINFGNNSICCVNSTEELVDVLDESQDMGSWIILTYHGIGLPDAWGYVTMDMFLENIDEIAKRNFWNASLNSVTKYTYLRNNTIYNYSISDDGVIKLSLSTNLDLEKFNHPLTFILEFDNSTDFSRYNVYVDGVFYKTLDIEDDRTLVDLIPVNGIYSFIPVE